MFQGNMPLHLKSPLTKIICLASIPGTSRNTTKSQPPQQTCMFVNTGAHTYTWQYLLVPQFKDLGSFVKVDQQNPPYALQFDLQNIQKINIKNRHFKKKKHFGHLVPMQHKKS